MNGVAQPFIGHQDNVNVSFQATATSPPGQIKVLIDFRNPIIIGRFVYHCHILEHEDGGMMAVAEVVPSVIASANQLAGRFRKVVDQAFDRAANLSTGRKRSDAAEAARIEQMLEAVQAGSYCTTKPAPPEMAKPDLTAIIQANLKAGSALRGER